MSFRCVFNETSTTDLGFETMTERHLLSEVITGGFRQFRDACE